MYCVIYEFIVDSEQEQEFQSLWHELTIKITEDHASLGARLHRVLEQQNTWVAYAQWKTKEDYDLSPTDPVFETLREKFLGACSEIKILYQLDLVDNLFSESFMFSH